MKRIQLDETELSVHHEGQGPPLLLVHGFPCDHTMWHQQIAEFSRDFEVIAPDLRGFGASGLGSEPVTMARLADDLADLLDALNVTQPLVFCGLSMGGYIAWQFWARHGARLGRLVLCDTRAAADSAEVASTRRESAAGVLKHGASWLVDGMVEKLFAQATQDNEPNLVQAMRTVMEATNPHTIAAALLAMAERPNMEPRLPEVSVPSLVICGQHDMITPVEEMRGLAAAMPFAQFQEIPAASHMAPVEQATAVNRAIREFLRADPASFHAGN